MRNFHPLEVVGRGSESQLQVGENLLYLLGTLRVNICRPMSSTLFIQYKIIHHIHCDYLIRPLGTQRCCDVESTSLTLIQRRNSVGMLHGRYFFIVHFETIYSFYQNYIL